MKSKLRHKIISMGIAIAFTTTSLMAVSVIANDTTTDTEAPITLTDGPITSEYKTKDLDTEYDDSSVTIKCNSTSAEFDSSAVSEDNSVITIASAGVYVISGTYNGQILVSADKSDYVHLILNGLSITNENGPAIYIQKCDKATITLADDTENYITDGTNYTFEDGEDEPDAALFSKADMSMNGNGTLTVDGKYADAIKCKKDLKIISGNYKITAVSEGIKGRNSVTIKDGQFDITSGDTAIKSTRDDDPEKGFVIVDGGDFTINAQNDGIHAETHLTINGGNIDIQNASEGLEGQMVDIVDGVINIVATDDGINASRIGSSSNKEKGGMNDGERPEMPQGGMNDGERPEMPQGGMNDGERPEMPQGGMNDGERPEMPQGGMNDGERPEMPQGGMGDSGQETDGQVYIKISGGTTTVSGDADCIDSNGDIELSGGTIFSSSPKFGITGTEAVLDADGTIELKRGVTFIATGISSEVSLDCEQNVICFYTESQQNASTIITLKDSDGNEITSYKATSGFSTVAITSPEITIGETYIVDIGGQETEVSVSEQETTVGTPTQSRNGMDRGNREQSSYTDVSKDASYYNAVSFLSKMGYISGTSDSTFSPDKTLTRAMAVTILGRIDNAQPTTSTNGFDDVETGAYYTDYVNWASENGIVSGYGDGKFGTNDSITQKQLQIIISNYAKKMGIDFTIDETKTNEAVTRGEFAETIYNAFSSQFQQNFKNK